VLRDNVSTLRGTLLHDGAFPPLADAEVQGVNIPVLLVTGDRSPAVFSHLTDRLEELLPIAERTEIPDASHIMFEENASSFNEAILGFIGRHHDGPT
jgi:pimeloyl-ACP methyl ester carboxylesterase